MNLFDITNIFFVFNFLILQIFKPRNGLLLQCSLREPCFGYGLTPSGLRSLPFVTHKKGNYIQAD